MAAIINHRNKIIYDIRSSSVLDGLKISMLLPPEVYLPKYAQFRPECLNSG